MAKAKKYSITLKTRKIQLVADKILLLRMLRKLNGRFWGIFGLVMLFISILINFAIRPELRDVSTAFSDFGTDVRTSPYFTAGLFAGAYGLWRWRNYLERSMKNPGLITLLITLIIIGLYMVAFLPLGWKDSVTWLHYFGFTLAGVSMSLTVLVDILLRKTRRGRNQRTWQLFRIVSLVEIIVGMIITIMSADAFDFGLDHSLLGESLILLGFGQWVLIKTYQAEGVKSGFSRALGKVVIIK